MAISVTTTAVVLAVYSSTRTGGENELEREIVFLAGQRARRPGAVVVALDYCHPNHS